MPDLIMRKIFNTKRSCNAWGSRNAGDLLIPGDLVMPGDIVIRGDLAMLGDFVMPGDLVIPLDLVIKVNNYIKRMCVKKGIFHNSWKTHSEIIRLYIDFRAVDGGWDSIIGCRINPVMCGFDMVAFAVPNLAL
ncbi:hypothetical protein J6590_020204 [Homalodisca vitripennis]|nr:hypothetical protein J6590_020204 [Homalodisca vitripennis]